MTPETLLYHLDECGVILDISADLTRLEVDAPDGILTPELLGLMAEQKPELLQLVYERRERDAIEWEGERTHKLVLLEGDPRLIEENRSHPMVTALISVMEKHRGGTIEFSRIEEEQKAA